MGAVFQQLAGGLLQAIGQRQASEASARAVQAQSMAFEANARIFEMNAAASLASAEVAKSRRERIGKARLASSAVKFLKGGVTLSGSPLAVLGEEAINEALAAEDLLFEGEIRATQQRNQASLQRFFAGQANQKASAISSDGFFRAGTTLLGSAIRAFDTPTKGKGK